jgi:hypothetical protein|tara:strand:+ start:295 stop:486 length:192 start_codon:yes stop_codon:yes gene_type:complete
MEMVDNNAMMFVRMARRFLDPVEIESLISILEVDLYELANRGDDVDELQEHEDFERADEYYGG